MAPTMSKNLRVLGDAFINSFDYDAAGKNCELMTLMRAAGCGMSCDPRFPDHGRHDMSSQAHVMDTFERQKGCFLQAGG